LNNVKTGPLTEAEMENLAKEGKIDRNTKIWKQGYDQWKSIGQTELSHLLMMAPPPVGGIIEDSGKVIDFQRDKFMILSLLSLLLPILIEIILSRHIFAIRFIFSIAALVFLFLDRSALKKAGHEVINVFLMLFFAIIHPIKRTKIYNDKYVYTILMIVISILWGVSNTSIYDGDIEQIAVEFVKDVYNVDVKATGVTSLAGENDEYVLHYVGVENSNGGRATVVIEATKSGLFGIPMEYKRPYANGILNLY